jgi:actin-related protein 6
MTEPTKIGSPPKKRRRAPSTNSRAKKSKTEASVRAPSAPPTQILVIDNGGDALKYGWATDDCPKRLPNVTARLAHQITVLVGDELSRVQNPNSLIGVTRSTERGMICNLGNQTQVWKRLLDVLGVIIPPNSEAANSLGWKVAARKAEQTKTIPSHSLAVVLLLPPHCPRLLLDQILYLWMEDFGVSHVGFGISSACAAQEHATWHTSCTVDLGWSSSLIVPTFRHKPIQPSAIRRLPLGGRHMINMLKYYMSYRQYNLMDQEFLLRDVLEKLAYVSLEFQEELKVARYKPSGRRSYDRDYVLPDYQTTHQGQIRLPYALQKDLEQEEKEEEDDEEDDEDDEDFEDEDAESGDDNEKDNNQGSDVDNEDDEEEESNEQHRKRLLQQRAQEERRRRAQQEEEQVLRVSVERFTIPEVLFRPRDTGLPTDMVALAPAIVQSIQACPKAYHAALYQSIRLTGGISQLPNLKVRLEQEVRALMPTEFQLKMELTESPMDQAWLGAKQWIQGTPYTQWSVSREEWETAGKRKAYARLLLSNGGVYV